VYINVHKQALAHNLHPCIQLKEDHDSHLCVMLEMCHVYLLAGGTKNDETTIVTLQGWSDLCSSIKDVDAPALDFNER